MPTFNNNEGGLSVRTKINDAITTVDALDQGLATTDSPSFVNLTSDLDLAAIAETKAVTAVDVFVYDTSKDSDGGAWRKRTQGTSWYNETLNTSTRGSRREFPAVAVIVAESNKVTIYDGDDPSLPMWMVIDKGGPVATQDMIGAGADGTNYSLAAKNGSIGAGVDGGLYVVDFLSDTGKKFRFSGVALYNDNISGRNSGVGFGSFVATGIVNNTVNDVAMTVLPDAPIDPATGLPVPTIAVATAGGVSVIADNGSVYDSSETAGMAFVSFNDSNRLFYNDDASDQVYYADTYAADGFSDGHYDTDAAPYTLPGNVTGLSLDAFGHADGLTVLAEDPNTQASGMVAHVTSSWNSGYQNGDIKGAFLSDTDDTDLVGSGELVTNGTFDTDISGWSATNAVISWDASGYIVVDDTANAGSDSNANQTITTVIGKKYVLSVDRISTTSAFWLEVFGATQLVYTGSLGATTGPYSVTFVADSTSTSIRLISSGTGVTKYDNVSVKLADEDRSVNNNGLIVNGTVTRTPVESGADLVSYSGFSVSNYLSQPYNADLDFGTGDFCVMGWLKQGANTAVETILERDSAVSAQRFTLAVNASGFLTFTCDDDTTARTATSNRIVDNDVWTHFVALYDGAGDVKIYLNGALDDTETGSALLTLNNASAVLNVGLAVDGAEPLTNADLALLRISATVPSDSQIRKIYEDEKFLFQENAQATLYGASDAVTALAHDPVTDLLHVGTSAGRSVFQGLRRVDNTTDAVGTAISASNNLIVEE